MPTYNDYPADIRAYDHDPHSPFYQDPYEALEDLTYRELKTLALEADDPAIDATLNARPDPYYVERYTALDLDEPYPHFEVWDDQFHNLRRLDNVAAFQQRAQYLRYHGLTPNPLIARHPYWTQAVAPTWTPARSAHITARILREYEDFLSNI